MQKLSKSHENIFNSEVIRGKKYFIAILFKHILGFTCFYAPFLVLAYGIEANILVQIFSIIVDTKSKSKSAFPFRKVSTTILVIFLQHV